MRETLKYGSGYDPKVRAANARPVKPAWGSMVEHRHTLQDILNRVEGQGDLYVIFSGASYHVVDKVRVEPIPRSVERRWYADVVLYGPVEKQHAGYVWVTSERLKTITVTCTGHTLPIDEFTAKFQLLFGM